MKKSILALCAAVACAIPLTTFAQCNYTCEPQCAPCAPVCDPCAPICKPWYLFAGVLHRGLFHHQLEKAAGYQDSDSYDLGWQIFLGRRVTKHFGVELGYVDLGRNHSNRSVFSDDTFVAVPGHIHEYVVPLRGTFSWTFCRDLTLSVLGGIHYYHNNFSHNGSGLTESGNESGIDFNFGLAAEYRFIDWLGLRLDAARYYHKSHNTDDDYADAISANLVVYF